MRLRWRFGHSSRDAFRALLEDDLLFFEEDPDPSGGGDPPGGGGGDPDPEPPAGDPDPQGGSGDPNPKAETVSGDEYRSKLAENKSLRERAKKAEEKLAELEKRDETEQQRRDRELDEERQRRSAAETEARELRVQVLAPRAGILPEAAKSAYALVSWDDVDVDDEKAVVAALKALKEGHGYLFKQTTTDGGSKDRSKENGELPDDASPHQRLKVAYGEKK